MPQGRPEIGPKVETRISEEDLAIVDRDANKQFIKRAVWIRNAIQRSLPYEAMGDRHHLDRALDATDGWLGACRDVATDREQQEADRVTQGIAYEACIDQMRDTLQRALGTIPVQELNAAYSQAEAAGGEETPERAELWGRAMGAGFAAEILDALLLTLPVDGRSVRRRANLDDPLMDLEP
jgi:hypothetical protein